MQAGSFAERGAAFAERGPMQQALSCEKLLKKSDEYSLHNLTIS